MTRATVTTKINVLSSGTLPAWYTSQASGQWRNFTAASQVLSSSGKGWAGTHPGGTSGYDMVLRAWSSAVLNTVGLYVSGAFVPGTWLVCWGGGHNDYYGNEVYAFGPLEAETPAWQRITDPTIPAPVNVPRSGVYPVSRHSYDALTYLPTVNKFISFGAAGYASIGFAYNSVDLFNFGVNPSVTAPWSSLPDLTNAGSTIGAVSAYNPSTAKAWGVGSGNGAGLFCYDVVANTLTTYAKDAPWNLGASRYLSASILPSSNLFVCCDSTGVVRCLDLNSPTGSFYAPTTTGSAPSGNVALKWDNPRYRFVAKSSQGGKTLWFLTPGSPPTVGGGTWTWTSVTPSTGDTPQANTQGSSFDYGYFGRLQVVNTGTISGALAVSDYDTPPSFYKF